MTRPLLRGLALALGLLALYSAPRFWILRGLTLLNGPYYGEGTDHLLHLDRRIKLSALRPAQVGAALPAASPAAPSVPASLTRPPGIYLLAEPWAERLGVLSVWTPQLTHALFSVCLVVGLLGLGAALGSVWLGYWAALLAVVAPPLVGASLYLNSDYPLAAMTTLGLFLLLRSEGFSRPGAGVLFALWCALGSWIKMSFGLYLLGPCLLTLGLGLRQAPRPGRRLLGVLLLAALGLGLLWLLLRLTHTASGPADLAWLLRRHLSGAPGDSGFPATRCGWLPPVAYALMITSGATLPLLALALPGLLSLHSGPRARLARLTILAALYGSYLLLALSASKRERYALPLHPLLCLATVWGAAQLSRPRLRHLALVAIFLCYLGFWPLRTLYASANPLPALVQRRCDLDLADPYWTDTAVPDEATLRSMRSPASLANCLVSRGIAALRAVVREGGLTSPLEILVVRWKSECPPPPDALRLRGRSWVELVPLRLIQRTTLAALPDQLVTIWGLVDEQIPGAMRAVVRQRRAAAVPIPLLILHPDDWWLEDHAPELPVASRHRVHLTCGGQRTYLSGTVVLDRPR